jgi:hypothetical protein
MMYLRKILIWKWVKKARSDEGPSVVILWLQQQNKLTGGDNGGVIISSEAMTKSSAGQPVRRRVG